MDRGARAARVRSPVGVVHMSSASRGWKTRREGRMAGSATPRVGRAWLRGSRVGSWVADVRDA